jgi:hypothetical protein
MHKPSLKLARRSTTLLATLDPDHSASLSSKDKRKRQKKFKKMEQRRQSDNKPQIPKTIGTNELAVLQMRSGGLISIASKSKDDSDSSDYDDLM